MLRAPVAKNVTGTLIPVNVMGSRGERGRLMIEYGAVIVRRG
jgi:hypothetical protein